MSNITNEFVDKTTVRDARGRTANIKWADKWPRESGKLVAVKAKHERLKDS